MTEEELNEMAQSYAEEIKRRNKLFLFDTLLTEDYKNKVKKTIFEQE